MNKITTKAKQFNYPSDKLAKRNWHYRQPTIDDKNLWARQVKHFSIFLNIFTKANLKWGENAMKRGILILNHKNIIFAST